MSEQSQDLSTDLFSMYFKYVEDTEPPAIFHRWALLTSIGATLGRNFYMEHGHWRVHCNLYTMFIGSPGTRKSTAIKLMKKVITGAGYETIAADKTTKEKFLVDLDGTHSDGNNSSQGAGAKNDQTPDNFWGLDEGSKDPREIYIMADEFNDFIGFNNLDFISLLGTLWDYEGVYQSKTKHGKSVNIPEPTISILGGNTPQNFALAFPPEIIGQGFLSRLILIHGEQSDRRITFPKAPEQGETQKLITYFKELQLRVRGKAEISTTALTVLDEIYQQWVDLEDVRFKHYSTRRFTQLLKISLIVAASRLSTSVEYPDVVKANTILAAAEHKMPTALGEFGKGKHSDVAQTILDFLKTAEKPMNTKELWKIVSKDLNKPHELAELLSGMVEADKLVHIPSKGFLAKGSRSRRQIYVDWALLTEEERTGLGL